MSYKSVFIIAAICGVISYCICASAYSVKCQINEAEQRLNDKIDNLEDRFIYNITEE